MSQKNVSEDRSTSKVLDQNGRRKFSPEYKLRILQEIDRRREEGKGVIGEILRREGLFSSQVFAWRNALEGVIASGIPEQKRGRKPDPTLAIRKENEKLQRKAARLEEDLRQARLIIEAQKKIAAMYRESPTEPEEMS